MMNEDAMKSYEREEKEMALSSCLTVGELKKALERFGDDFPVYVFAGNNNSPAEMPVISAGVGLDGPDLGLETGPLEPEQRGVLLRVGEPLDPDGGPVPKSMRPRRPSPQDA